MRSTTLRASQFCRMIQAVTDFARENLDPRYAAQLKSWNSCSSRLRQHSKFANYGRTNDARSMAE